MKKILILSLLVLFGCSNEELPDSNYEMVVLTAYASEGGYVRSITVSYTHLTLPTKA